MQKLSARVVSLHAITKMDPTNAAKESLSFELDGIVGDRHRGIERACYAGDKQPKDSRRRNERMWSAMSVEEVAEITEEMDLAQPLTPEVLTTNLYLEGCPELTRLPKGSMLKFPSGAELIVEEANAPCLDKGTQIAESFTTNSGKPIENTTFSKVAKLKRGLLGVVEVAGDVHVGDEIEITVYEHPSWLARS